MNPREFCYWLQGFFEVVQPKSLTKDQVAAIKEKLDESLEDPMKALKALAAEKAKTMRPNPGRWEKKSAYDLRSSAGTLSRMRTYC